MRRPTEMAVRQAWRKRMGGMLLFILLIALAACQGGDEESNPNGSSPSHGERFGTEPLPKGDPLPGIDPSPENGEGLSSAIPYRVEVVAERLNVPWSLDIAPDGRIFFTERPGRIRVIEDGKLREEPVFSFTDPFLSEGEGGLLGIALDPRFDKNAFIYVYHTYRENGDIKNRVLRLRLKGGQAEIDKVLLDNIPGNRFHNGGRIKVGPDGYLYMTTGDAYRPELAQDLSSLAGKILRIALDGTLPPDNPFDSSPVYSWGHRNPQGLAWHPFTHALFSSEHGPSAHDEINRIEPGANYGWPKIRGDEKGEGTEHGANLRVPLLHSGEETWAPSGMTFVSRGPWQGDLLVANLRGEQALRMTIGDSMEIAGVEPFFKQEFGRLRDIVEGPDGSLYLLTNNRDGRGKIGQGDDKIIKLSPNTPITPNP